MINNIILSKELNNKEKYSSTLKSLKSEPRQYEILAYPNLLVNDLQKHKFNPIYLIVDMLFILLSHRATMNYN